ncbi:RNA-binding protein 28 [Bicyclus anynana]|uniref:RNA-binding protein 28 n=1 Tax=Bicyclus anynana TaxID=110368 RepID=A0ABM3M0B8_BICAN|nr:RNA-binding protein 28 [Bicyclus anynana]
MSEAENVDTETNSKYKDGVNKNARLIIKNVSFKATENSLKEHFSQYGKVEEINLLKKPDGKLVGSAFVHYTQVPMAQKALVATNKKPFLGRPIFVSWAVPKHKYNEEENKKGKPTRYFNYDLTDDSKPDIKTEDETEDKKNIKEDKNQIRLNRRARLIIRNISFKATEETLKQHFEPYGVVQEVSLLKKPDGKMVGCGFVLFKNVQMAKEALSNTNMKPFLGRPISVDWAVPKNQYMQHVVNKQIELEDSIKKEESDSDDDTPMNVSTDDVKDEIKSESGDSSDGEDASDSEEDKVKSEDDDDNDEEDSAGDESDEEDEDEDDDKEAGDPEDDDGKSVTSTQPDFKRVKLNDAEDGCTVFLTNIPFSVNNEQLQAFAETTGPVKYALICVDKLTEHSKGSGFVKFVNKDDAESFLSLPAEQLRLEGQVLQVKPALKRENLQKGDKKQPKDNRNLYLVKEGVIVAGTKAALGVSASDMSKRLTLERSKTQMLKNLNRFVSRYRIVVSNLPPHYDDSALRRVCAREAGERAVVTECRVMRDLRAPLARDGKHPSKGYGFVMFTRHEDALLCLRKLNNNPDIFDKNNRPIVSFSIEDRTALNARKKRLEKSIANNPLASQGKEQENPRKNRKRKHNSAPDESYMKKGRFDKAKQDNKNKQNGFGNKNNEQYELRKNRQNKFGKRNNQNNDNSVGKFVRRPIDDVEYAGLTAKEGSQHKMRSNHKLKTQADVHRQNVKQEKKMNKKSQRLKMAARERIKQPKQKINKNKIGKRNKKRKFNEKLM